MLKRLKTYISWQLFKRGFLPHFKSDATPSHPRVVFQHKVQYPLRMTVGAKVIDLKPGEWLLFMGDGRICGWTDEQTQAAVAWAQSGGTLPCPEIV